MNKINVINIKVECHIRREGDWCGLNDKSVRGYVGKNTCCLHCNNYLKCVGIMRSKGGNRVTKNCPHNHWCSHALITLANKVNLSNLDKMLIKAGKLKINYE